MSVEFKSATEHLHDARSPLPLMAQFLIPKSALDDYAYHAMQIAVTLHGHALGSILLLLCSH